MKEKIRTAAAAFLLAGLIILCWQISVGLREIIDEGKAASRTVGASTGTIILDPGHGGKDPGKIGINGAKEKEINLNIALKIQNILAEKGVPVSLTRKTDERLADSQVEDLKERVEMINEIHPVLTVSIHQNSYSDENVKGAQVFYYKGSEEGESAAGYIQEELAKLDPENAKQIKANDTYYLLKNTEAAVIIVECGFLSNYEEAEELTSETYQKKIAEAVAAGIAEYTEERLKRTAFAVK